MNRPMILIWKLDREFLDGLVTKVYEFGGGAVKEHLGGIYDFLQKKSIDNLSQLQSASQVFNVVDKETQEVCSENKLSYEAQKELNKRIRKLERLLQNMNLRLIHWKKNSKK